MILHFLPLENSLGGEEGKRTEKRRKRGGTGGEGKEKEKETEREEEREEEGREEQANAHPSVTLCAYSRTT